MKPTAFNYTRSFLLVELQAECLQPPNAEMLSFCVKCVPPLPLPLPLPLLQMTIRTTLQQPLIVLQETLYGQKTILGGTALVLIMTFLGRGCIKGTIVKFYGWPFRPTLFYPPDPKKAKQNKTFFFPADPTWGPPKWKKKAQKYLLCSSCHFFKNKTDGY